MRVCCFNLKQLQFQLNRPATNNKCRVQQSFVFIGCCFYCCSCFCCCYWHCNSRYYQTIFSPSHGRSGLPSLLNTRIPKPMHELLKVKYELSGCPSIVGFEIPEKCLFPGKRELKSPFPGIPGKYFTKFVFIEDK